MKLKTTKFVVLRGNSASGKTAVAQRIHQSFAQGQSMLISQDVLRLEILNVKDRPNNLAVDLMEALILSGVGKVEVILLEGILGKAKHGEKLKEWLNWFADHSYVYYFDLPFTETLKRHATREKAQEFSEEQLAKWWLPNDQLERPDEKIISSAMTIEQIETMIRNDLRC